MKRGIEGGRKRRKKHGNKREKKRKMVKKKTVRGKNTALGREGAEMEKDKLR